MKIYKVTTDQGIFEMVAPLHVIASVYKIHEAGVARIEHDAEAVPVKIYFNGRNPRLIGIQVTVYEGGTL